MKRRQLSLMVLGLLLSGSAASAQASLRMINSFPSANAIMDGRSTRFSVMFDGPVDHAASRLVIEQNGVVQQILTPRLNSQPNTLYSDGHPLKPGDYTLRWDAHGQHGGAIGTGAIAFKVGVSS